MAVFAIISKKPEPALRAAIEKNHAGNFYHWSDRVSFITATGTAAPISSALGVKTSGVDKEVLGTIDDTVVTQLAPSYWGWSGAEFWTWLTNAHQGDQA